MDFKDGLRSAREETRQPGLRLQREGTKTVPGTPFSPDDLNAIVVFDRRQSIRDRAAIFFASQTTIDEWMEKDLDAQSLIVKYFGNNEQTHVRYCDFAYQM